MPTIKELAKIYVQLGDSQSALELFEEALHARPDPLDSQIDLEDEDTEVVAEYSMGAASAFSRIGFEELNMMCELCFELSDYEKAMDVILTCTRNLKQVLLDGNVDEAIDQLDIPLEIRVKFGICRVHQDLLEEAKVIFSFFSGFLIL